MADKIKFSDSKNKVDIAQLLKLYRQVSRSKNRKAKDVRVMLKNCGLALTLWDGKHLIGFARVLTDFVYRAAIYDVIVDHKYRGQGLGKKIVLKILNHPKLAEVEKFWLSTNDKQAFYRKFGFIDDPSTGIIFKRRSLTENPKP